MDNNGQQGQNEQQLITIDNNGQQSAVLHASVMPFLKKILLQVQLFFFMPTLVI